MDPQRQSSVGDGALDAPRLAPMCRGVAVRGGAVQPHDQAPLRIVGGNAPAPAAGTHGLRVPEAAVRGDVAREGKPGELKANLTWFDERRERWR